MTKSSYANYVSRVNEFMDLASLSSLDCEKNCEPYFSHQPCDCCRRNLSGNRHDAFDSNGELFFSVCDDCVYFAAYGELCDDEMDEINSK